MSTFCWRSLIRFGSGSGAILLDDVQCRGFETSLIDCSRNMVGDHDCIHEADVGLQCGSKWACLYVVVVVVSNLSFTSYDGNMPINEDAK